LPLARFARRGRPRRVERRRAEAEPRAPHGETRQESTKVNASRLLLVTIVAASLAAAETTTKTVTIKKDGSILVNGKDSTSNELEASFTDAEKEGHPPDVRIQIRFEDGASIPVLRTIVNKCTKHKVHVESYELLGVDASKAGEAALAVEMRFD